MGVVVYVETNFLVGYAHGRSEAAVRLMDQPPVGVRLLVPSPCIMESLSVLESTRRGHRRLLREGLGVRISECERGVALPDRTAALAKLTESALVLEDLFARFQDRLYSVLERIGIDRPLGAFEPPAHALRRMLERPVMDDPTDRLVLWAIVEHAAQAEAGARKIFHTQDGHFRVNGEAKAMLAECGVEFEANPEALLARLIRLGHDSADPTPDAGGETA